MTSTGALTSNTAVHRRKTSPRSTPAFAAAPFSTTSSTKISVVAPLSRCSKTTPSGRVSSKHTASASSGNASETAAGVAPPRSTAKARRTTPAVCVGSSSPVRRTTAARREASRWGDARRRARRAGGHGARRGAADMARVAECGRAGRRRDEGRRGTGRRRFNSTLSIRSIVFASPARIGIRRRGRRI